MVRYPALPVVQNEIVHFLRSLERCANRKQGLASKVGIPNKIICHSSPSNQILLRAVQSE